MSTLTIVAPVGTLLKKTTSRCLVCHKQCPAEVFTSGTNPQQVFLKRTCPEHGEASVCISSDARFYWLAKGDPANASCCSGGSCCSASGETLGTLGRNANPGEALGKLEELSTCLALIEIVNSCNLTCPTCYANSPQGAGAKVDAVPLSDLQRRIQGVIDRKGKIEILQLSGGEPTLHPQFFELLDWIRQNPNIDYILLNTNGVRIATDPDFVRQLGDFYRQKDDIQLYLQFDGVQEAGQKALRGADLRSLRERAIARCGEIGIGATLAMTVTRDNLAHLWETIAFGLKYPQIRGVSFQPIFGSGRISEALVAKSITSPINTADIIIGAVEQSRGKLRFEDFTPLPCGDPNCATVGYLIRWKKRVHSISKFVDFARVQGFLKDKVRYSLEDLIKCGCESEELGGILKKLETEKMPPGVPKESIAFRLFVKPFMDARTWDQDRIDRCCTHVIRPDGRLDSFCRYYSGFSDTKVVA